MANNGLDLWVERFRPNTLDGYVFKNERMKLQVEEWVENKQKKKIPIPHLLLSGGPGTGKCLDGDELIEIEIDTSLLSFEQKRILGIE